MEEIHNTQYDRHWETQPLDSVCEAPADPIFDSVCDAPADPPLDTVCDAPADPPLDTVYDAPADPPLDIACDALVDSPLQNMRECRILGSTIQDLWEHKQCLILGSWRNGTKTQTVMDIWLKYK